MEVENQGLAEAAKSFLEDKVTDSPKETTAEVGNNTNEQVIENAAPEKQNDVTNNVEAQKPNEEQNLDKNAEKKSWRQHYEETPEYKEEKRKQDESLMLSKMKEYEEFQNSEIGKLWEKSKAEKKSFVDVVKEFQYSDVTKLTDEEKFVKSIEQFYANDENKEDLLKEQWELFNQKPDFEKRKALSEITNTLLKEQQEKIAKFTPQQTQQEQADPKEVEKFRIATQELNSYLDSIVKTEVNGIKITPVRVERIYNAVNDLPTSLFTDETGKLDMKKAVDIANYALFGDVIINKAKADAKQEGRVEVLGRRHNQSVENAHNLPIGGERQDSLKAAAAEYAKTK